MRSETVWFFTMDSRVAMYKSIFLRISCVDVEDLLRNKMRLGIIEFARYIGVETYRQTFFWNFLAELPAEVGIPYSISLPVVVNNTHRHSSEFSSSGWLSIQRIHWCKIFSERMRIFCNSPINLPERTVQLVFIAYSTVNEHFTSRSLGTFFDVMDLFSIWFLCLSFAFPTTNKIKAYRINFKNIYNFIGAFDFFLSVLCILPAAIILFKPFLAFRQEYLAEVCYYRWIGGRGNLFGWQS